MVRKSDLGIKSNAFHPYPKNTDEISVTRYDYSDNLYCKKVSKLINKKGYNGLASLYAYNIYKTGSNIDFTPVKHNKYHADIRIGYVTEVGKTMNPECKERIKELADYSKFHKDECPEEIGKWCGEEKIVPNRVKKT